MKQEVGPIGLIFTALLSMIGMLMPAAAQRVEYRYDAAGNRVLKQIVLARSQAQRGMAPAADKVAGIGLTLWSTPTTG